MTAPNDPGQWVRDSNGRIGITTDYSRVRTPTIPVMFAEGRYPVVAQLDDLTVIDKP